MKKRSFLLLLVFIIHGCCFSQNETRNTITVEFNFENYIDIIKNEISKLDVEWIYYKPVIIKIKSNDSSLPPPPQNILAFKKDNFELFQKDFIDVQVIKSEKIFEKIDLNKLEETFTKRKKEFGIGVVFSIPYKWENEKTVYIDYQIINWDYLCGTGTYNSLIYK
jgi:hypothetical protein